RDDVLSGAPAPSPARLRNSMRRRGRRRPTEDEERCLVIPSVSEGPGRVGGAKSERFGAPRTPRSLANARGDARRGAGALAGATPKLDAPRGRRRPTEDEETAVC